MQRLHSIAPAVLGSFGPTLPLAAGDAVPWLTALVGAVVGFVARELYAWWQERRRFIALMRGLLAELRQIKTDAERRVQASSAVAGTVEPPLPVEAWRLALASGQLGRLAEVQLDSLRLFYSSVVTANHVAGNWSAFLQISRLSDDPDVQVAFDAEAARVIREPCEPIAAEVDAVIAGLTTVVR